MPNGSYWLCHAAYNYTGFIFGKSLLRSRAKSQNELMVKCYGQSGVQSVSQLPAPLFLQNTDPLGIEVILMLSKFFINSVID